MVGLLRNYGEFEDVIMVMMYIDRIFLLLSKMQNFNIEDYRDYYEVFVLSVIFNLLIIILGVEIMVLFEIMEVMGL